ncbi:MAG: cardiolipin synthase ClsB, partial [Hylemonella sp.]
NLDPLSLLSAREANIVVQDPGFAAGLRQRLLEAIDKEGKRVDPATYAQRPWRQRQLDLLALGLVRFAFFLSGIRY